ncbi:uncharacterized protein LOC124133402 isoform X4 [Haliotis rufescens]|uniref:uncharacterized protein LOC124133402 isoform X4 n=1 Tax=Haliotis rufescens TaxID=6454 RepID=UPI00201F0BBA|nr:uncharacterized protein LOC124133402 isoform X4 [Haliotis rufescens]
MAVWTHLTFLSFMCTVTPVISQFNSGCTQLDKCGVDVSPSFSSSDGVFICRSVVSYRTCAQNAKRVCVGNIDNSEVEQFVLNIYTQYNCTAVLKEITTSVEMSPVTARISESGLSTKGSPGFHQSRKTSTQSTDHTGYGTRSSTEMKKSSSQIPGTFPTTPPAEEEDSTRDASNPQGVGTPSSGTDSSMAVSTLSAVAVIWVGWTMHVTIT